MKTKITAMAAAALLLSTSIASAHSPGIVRGGGITRGFNHPGFGQIRRDFGRIRPGFASYGYAGGNVGAGIVGAILGIAAGALSSRLTAPVVVAPPVCCRPTATISRGCSSASARSRDVAQTDTE